MIIIKEIALEIAMLGALGINPAKGNNYKLKNIQNKDFTGYQLWAFNYVSWSLAIPDMLEQLNLPYASEYKMSKSKFVK